MNRLMLTIVCCLGSVGVLGAQSRASVSMTPSAPGPQGAELLRAADQAAPDPLVSPVQRIQRQRADAHSAGSVDAAPAIDGSDHDPGNPAQNAAGQPLRRRFPVAYSDGVSAMAGALRPSARQVSNVLHAQSHLLGNDSNASDFLWQWGQFIDHDIDLTDGADPAELAPIQVPSGDQWFDPAATGTVTITLNRSIHDPASGLGIANPRQQLNEITGWLDASMVYGSDVARAAALRTFADGLLATSPGDLLPFNRAGLPNAGGSSDQLFLAGDVRANEQIALTAVHTLFVREHNWWARQIRRDQPDLDDEQIYQRARSMVSAEIQAITYREFLPLLLGNRTLPPYRGYNPGVDARIANSFSTAAYRIGHSLLSPTLLRLGPDLQPIAQGNLALRDAFFSPQRLSEGGIDALLRGLATQRCQDLDVYVIDDVRNFLFGAPGNGGFDLAALNIQRGRDHGLPSYVAVRAALGLPPIHRFEDINPDRQVSDRLARAYQNPLRIDLWSGLLAEVHAQGAMVGPTLQRLLTEQFAALRDGDRYYYEARLAPADVEQIKVTRLADIIRRNSNIGAELSNDVFRVAPAPR
jgi:peroxidase